MQPLRSHAAASAPRVLLVEDHPITRLGLRQLIEAQGCVVSGEAENATEALRLVEAQSPHLAVVDLLLPETNGIDLTRALRIRSPRTEVLVLSCLEEATYAPRALQAGAKGYLMKAEAVDHLARALRNVGRGEIFLSPRMQAHALRQVALGRRQGSKHGLEALSSRERQVFGLLGEGRSTRQISEILGVNIKTVESYRNHLRRKLDAQTGDILVHRAIEWAGAQERLAGAEQAASLPAV